MPGESKPQAKPRARRVAPAAAEPPAPRRAAAPPSAAPVAATRVLRQFRLVFNAVKTHFQQIEKSAGVGGAQVWALSVVRDRPGLGVGELARTMDIHQSTASNLVRLLAERDLLAIERKGEDRRTVQLRLRPEGARLLRRTPGPFVGVLPRALAGLDEATLGRLERDLDVLLAKLQPDKRAARKPMTEL